MAKKIFFNLNGQNDRKVFSLWGVETPKLGKNKEPYTVLGKHRLLLHIDTLTSGQSSSQNSRN